MASDGALITSEEPGAFVSEMVARGEHHMVAAFRHEPLDELDSGWQFTAGEADDMRDAQLWRLSEVVAFEPSIAAFLDLPWDVALVRENEDGPWLVCEVETPLH